MADKALTDLTATTAIADTAEMYIEEGGDSRKITGGSSKAAMLAHVEANASAFASAAQGGLADSALQAADIGVSVQAYAAQLDTWAGVTPSANGQSLVGAADYAAMRGLLDLEPGTDFLSISAIAAAYQPLDADLTALAALTTPATKLAGIEVSADVTDATNVAAAGAVMTTGAQLVSESTGNELTVNPKFSVMGESAFATLQAGDGTIDGHIYFNYDDS